MSNAIISTENRYQEAWKSSFILQDNKHILGIQIWFYEVSTDDEIWTAAICSYCKLITGEVWLPRPHHIDSK